MRWSVLIPMGVLVCGGGEMAQTADDLVEASGASANEMIARGVDAWVEASANGAGGAHMGTDGGDVSSSGTLGYTWGQSGPGTADESG